MSEDNKFKAICINLIHLSFSYKAIDTERVLTRHDIKLSHNYKDDNILRVNSLIYQYSPKT